MAEHGSSEDKPVGCFSSAPAPLDARSPSTFSPYIKVVVLALAQAFSFLLSVHGFASLDPGNPEDFLLCTQQHPCSYARFFSSAGVNSTFAWHSARLPGFHMSYPQVSIAEVPAADSDTWRQDVCEDLETRKQILNPMPNSISTWVFVVGILLWSCLKILHDWLLLAGYPEPMSLTVGWLSHVSQRVAACGGFVLATGAVEVFTIDDSSKACYYQIPDVPAMLSLVTPVLLLVMGIFKERALFLSIINGDFLYAQRYDIPFHLVHQSPGWTGGDLLVPLVTGGQKGADRKLPAEFYKQSLWNMYYSNQFIKVFCSPIIAASTYPMFVRYFRILDSLLGNTHDKSGLMQAIIHFVMLLPFGVGFVDVVVRLYFYIPRLQGALRKKDLVTGRTFAMQVLWQGISLLFYNSCSCIVFVLLFLRNGIIDKITVYDDTQTIIRFRAGLKTLMTRYPREFLETAKARPTFVQMYLARQVQLAEFFLQQHPSYDQGNDSEGLWQQMLNNDWQGGITPCTNENEMRAYEMLTQSE